MCVTSGTFPQIARDLQPRCTRGIQCGAVDTALGARIAILVFVGVSAAIAGNPQSAPPPEPPAVYGARMAEERTIDWAVRRYRLAALGSLPPLDVHFHPTGTGCHGNLGVYYLGRIDLCTRYSSEPYARKYALHELAHAWIDANAPAAALQEFMRLRRIEAWDDRNLPWEERGSEQAAEIMAWGLGEGEIAPTLPDAPDPATLTRLYELLTGREPLTPAAR